MTINTSSDPVINEYTLEQLIVPEQIQNILDAHQRISGMACGLMDNDENIIVASGLQEVCTGYHWDNPVSFARCWRNDAVIRNDLRCLETGMYECLCQNGMVNVAMPLIIAGRRCGTFFAGQFFYDDTQPDMAWFQGQAEELGFDPEHYLQAVRHAPVFSRTHVDDTMRFLHQIVQLLAETGHANFVRLRLLDEQRQTERELRLLIRAVDVSSEAVFLINCQGRFTYVNDTACHSLGYSRNELLTMTPLDIDPDITPDEFAKLLGNLLAADPARGYIESRHRARDGRMFPVELSASVIEIDGTRFGLIVARDISERKKAEQQLKLLNHALDHVHEGAFLINLQGRFLYVNQEACHSLGYSQDELCGMDILDIDPHFSPEELKKNFSELLELGTLTFETMHRARNGQVFPVEITTSVLEYDGVKYFLSLVRGIAERKIMEETLRESEEKFRTLAENSPDNIVRYDTACRMVYVNPQVEKTLGMAAADLLGKTPKDKKRSGEDRHAYQDKIGKVLATGEDDEIDLILPDCGDGEQYHNVRFVAERGVGGAVTGVLAIGRDITERKQAEKDLREKQQRLNDMALELAMSEERERCRIATELHDTLGQDLTLVRLRLGVLAKSDIPEELVRMLDTIREPLETAINRVRGLIRLISPPILESAGLEAALKWLGRQMEAEYGLLVTFSDDLRDKPLPREYQTEIYNAVRELLINVVKHAETKNAGLAVARDDRTFVVTVEDNGIGSNADIASAMSDGGFGLFNLRRRLSHFGGTVHIDSAPGTGTRVIIRMPLKPVQG